MELIFLFAGKPRAPRIDGRVEVVGGGQFRISWRTDSYARIEQYRLLYRKAPVSSTQHCQTPPTCLVCRVTRTRPRATPGPAWWSPARTPCSRTPSGTRQTLSWPRWAAIGWRWPRSWALIGWCCPAGDGGGLPGAGPGQERPRLGEGVRAVQLQDQHSRYIESEYQRISGYFNATARYFTHGLVFWIEHSWCCCCCAVVECLVS